jgi:hypothetical protein
VDQRSTRYANAAGFGNPCELLELELVTTAMLFSASQRFVERRLNAAIVVVSCRVGLRSPNHESLKSRFIT